MDEGSQQGTKTQQPLAYPGIAHQKVLLPSESFVAEVKASQQSAHDQIQPVPQDALQTSPPESSQPLQSAQPEPIYNEPRPTTGSQVPVGMSASQMGFSQSQRGRNWKSVLKPVLVAVVILVVLGAGFLVYKGLGGYSTRTVQGDGFTYTIIYNKSASEVSINGKSYLQGQDKSGQTMLLYVGKSVQSTFDCYTSVGSTISIIATPAIDGQQHNLCYSQSLKAYDMNFTYNDVWYYLTIFPKDKSQTLNQDTVKMVASSVRISR